MLAYGVNIPREPFKWSDQERKYRDSLTGNPNKYNDIPIKLISEGNQVVDKSIERTTIILIKSLSS